MKTRTPEFDQPNNREFSELIEYDFESGLQTLVALADQKSKEQEQVIILVNGLPNAGKTTLSRNFCSLTMQHPEEIMVYTGINSLEIEAYLVKAQKAKYLIFEDIFNSKNAKELADSSLVKYLGKSVDINVYIYNPSINQPLSKEALEDTDIIIRNTLSTKKI